MSQPIDDGGPAFPHLNPNYDGNWDKEPQRGGMSVRALLAGLSLQGLNAHHGRSMDSETAARLAVHDADALIKALKGGKES